MKKSLGGSSKTRLSRATIEATTRWVEGMRKKRLKLHRFEVNEIDRIKKRLEAVRSSYMKNFRDYEDVPLG